MKKAFLFFFTMALCLSAVYGQQAKLILPMGHTYPVTNLQFSTNGKKVLTAAKFGAIKIWDRYTGMLLVDLKGSNSMISETFFSPDSRLVFATCVPWGQESYIWDALDGRLIYTSSEIGRNASFSADSRYLYSFASDSITKVDTRTGAASKLKLPVQDPGRACFSPDGSRLFVITSDSSWKLFETSKGETLASGNGLFIYDEFCQISANNQYVVFSSQLNSLYLLDLGTGSVDSLSGHKGRIWAGSFSPSGRMLSTCSEDTTVKIWDLETKREVATLQGHHAEIWSAKFSVDETWAVTSSSDSTVRIWDLATARSIFQFNSGSYESAGVLSPDKKEFATLVDQKPVIVDLLTGLTRIHLDGVVYYTDRVQYSNDGKLLITAPFAGNAILWDAVTMRQIGKLEESHHHSLTFSKDGKRIWGESTIHSSVGIWDALSGRQLASYKRPEKFVFNYISDDGRFVVWHTDSSVLVQNNETGDLSKFNAYSQSALKTSLSGDGKILLFPIDLLELNVVEVLSGKKLYSIYSETEISSAAFFDDDRKILTTTVDSAFVRELSTGRLLYALPHGSISLHEELGLLLSKEENDLKTWDMFTGAFVSSLKGHKDVITSTFSDTNSLLTVSKDRVVKVWDPKTGACLRSFALGPGIFNFDASVDFSGNRFVASNIEAVDFFDLATGSKLYSLLQLDTLDYLVHDEAGRFDGTVGARTQVMISCGDELISLQQLKDKLWVPKLAERLNNREVITTTSVSDLQICGVTPVVEQVDDVGFYNYRIIPRKGGLGETILYVNGIETRTFSPLHLGRREGYYELRLPASDVSSYFVDGQDNVVTLKSFIADNTVSSRGESEVNSSRRQIPALPKLYAVFIGVDDYNDDALDLKFAGKDAIDLSVAVKAASSKLLGNENVFIYRLDTSAGRTAYPEKKQIQNVFREIGKVATPNDILLVFFAGHGVVLGESKQFYFLTKEATSATVNPKDVVDVGIGSSELMEWMRPDRIKAQKRILVLDACNSGAAINQIVTIGGGDKEYFAARNDDKVQQLKQIDKLNERSGLYVLSAAASDQKAYEFGKYSQGLLTYSLLRAIKEDRGVLEEAKYLNVSKWFNSSVDIAGEIIRENMLSQDPQLISTTSFQIGQVDDEVLSSIRLAEEKPVFAGSNLQNNDPVVMDDDLGLSLAVNQVLSGVFSRGVGEKVIYAPQTSSSLAWSLVGRYMIEGDEVTVTINLKRNNKVEKRMEIKGSKNALALLAEKIVVSAVDWILTQ